MTLFRTQNQPCLGGNHTTWWLLKTMLDAGWTMPFSGSGSGGLYDSSNVFDTAQDPKQYSQLSANGVGIGSEPWGHPYCWAVMQDPSGNRQYVLMRDTGANDTNDDEWYFGYSPAGRFGEGQVAGVDWDQDTPTAAPDQIDIAGTTSAHVALFETGGTTSVVHVLADDTPSPAGEYGVFLVNIVSVNNPISALFLDDVRNVPVGHPHPLAMLAVRSDGGIFTPNLTSAYTIRDYGGGTELWVSVRYACQRYWSTDYIPWRAGINRDGKIRCTKALVGFSNSVGYMGSSRWFLWKGTGSGYPTTGNGGKDVVLDSVVIKDLFDGTEPPRTV